MAVFEFESFFANYASELDSSVFGNTAYDVDPSVYATKVERVIETPTPSPVPGDPELPPQQVVVRAYGPTQVITAIAIVVVGCALVGLGVWLALRTPKKTNK